MGRVTVGRDFAASDTILAGISPLGTAYGVGSAQRAFGVFSLNVQNMVRYLSPSFSGLTVGLTYSFGGSTVLPSPGAETFGNSTKNRLFGAGLRYANGPILVAGNYTQIMPRNNFGNTTPKNWLVGGSYDFKVAKAHLAYGQNIDGVISGTTGIESLGGASGTNFGIIGSGTLAQQGARTNQWMAGVSAPVGNGTAMFSISQMRPGGNLDTAVTSTMTNLGVVYSYNLSKRTSVYASYSYANNYSMIEGLKVNQVGAGVVHLF
ncbi:MAG: porin [Burkholderiaceae bacterium]|nr:porin [Burkholderiaceae bacterium]